MHFLNKMFNYLKLPNIYGHQMSKNTLLTVTSKYDLISSQFKFNKKVKTKKIIAFKFPGGYTVLLKSRRKNLSANSRNLS